MAIKVRTGTGPKWTRRASAAGDDYKAGVQDPRREWGTATREAEGAWTAGVQQAVAQKRWTKSISSAAQARWTQRASQLGPERYASGVSSAQSAYEEAMRPYLAALAAITLPSRGAKGDLKNLDRVKVVTQTLRAVKLGTALPA